MLVLCWPKHLAAWLSRAGTGAGQEQGQGKVVQLPSVLFIWHHMTLSSIMQPHRASVSPFALHVRLKVTGCAWLGLARQIIALNISYVAQFSLKTCSRLPSPPCMCTCFPNDSLTESTYDTNEFSLKKLLLRLHSHPDTDTDT